MFLSSVKILVLFTVSTCNLVLIFLRLLPTYPSHLPLIPSPHCIVPSHLYPLIPPTPLPSYPSHTSTLLSLPHLYTPIPPTPLHSYPSHTSTLLSLPHLYPLIPPTLFSLLSSHLPIFTSHMIFSSLPPPPPPLPLAGGIQHRAGGTASVPNRL